MTNEIKKILVATDGSETANKAITESRQWAECMNSKVTILNVVDKIESQGVMSREFWDDIEEKLKKEGRKLLDESLKIFEGSPVQVDAVCRIGKAANEIMAEADKGDYDLIIMGNKGKGAISRTVLGSVSNKVLNHSDRRILIVR